MQSVPRQLQRGELQTQKRVVQLSQRKLQTQKRVVQLSQRK